MNGSAASRKAARRRRPGPELPQPHADADAPAVVRTRQQTMTDELGDHPRGRRQRQPGSAGQVRDGERGRAAVEGFEEAHRAGDDSFRRFRARHLSPCCRPRACVSRSHAWAGSGRWLGCHQKASTSGTTSQGHARRRTPAASASRVASWRWRSATRGVPATRNGTGRKLSTTTWMSGSTPIMFSCLAAGVNAVGSWWVITHGSRASSSRLTVSPTLVVVAGHDQDPVVGVQVHPRGPRRGTRGGGPCRRPSAATRAHGRRRSATAPSVATALPALVALRRWPGDRR